MATGENGQSGAAARRTHRPVMGRRKKHVYATALLQEMMEMTAAVQEKKKCFVMSPIVLWIVFATQSMSTGALVQRPAPR